MRLINVTWFVTTVDEDDENLFLTVEIHRMIVRISLLKKTVIWETVECYFAKNYGFAIRIFLLLVCTWRHGGHVGGQAQKHFSPLGTKLYFHVNSSRKYSFVLTPNMAALSHGCKPRIVHKKKSCASKLQKLVKGDKIDIRKDYQYHFHV